ncbi:MAG: archaellin/type IV pilin N-terminal domain-containing protein [Candidatus Aenigmatarchaeota archaeon]
MERKGISTVIATLLMLMITIALAGAAYTYISGVFTARTAVILSVVGEPYCQPGGTTNAITFWLMNDGTSPATGLTATSVPGNPSSVTCSFNPTTISPGNYTTVTCNRAAAGTGYYGIRVSSGSSATTVRIYCPS